MVVMNKDFFGTIAGLEYSHYKTRYGTVFTTPDGKPYSPNLGRSVKAYGVDAIRIDSAEAFKPAL